MSPHAAAMHTAAALVARLGAHLWRHSRRSSPRASRGRQAPPRHGAPAARCPSPPGAPPCSPHPLDDVTGSLLHLHLLQVRDRPRVSSGLPPHPRCPCPPPASPSPPWTVGRGRAHSPARHHQGRRAPPRWCRAPFGCRERRRRAAWRTQSCAPRPLPAPTVSAS